MDKKEQKMKKFIEKTFLVLAGFIVGFVLSIGIKYPLLMEELNRAELICGPTLVEKVSVGVTGNIYTVTCKNTTTYELKN